MPEITFDELDEIEYVGSILEIMSCMATNDSINTCHVANVAAECSGKVKKVLESIKMRKSGVAGY